MGEIVIGTVIDGKYKVERIIGEGGMGIVLLANHLQLEQRVAIKLLRPEADSRGVATERFMREAQLAARIKNEHVARVYDVGNVDGHPYIVMEHLEGADLGAILYEEGRIPVPLAITYVLEACEAFAEAHAAGIVHRDIKPSNLFLARRPDGTDSVKVLDFGIAKRARTGAQSLKDTREGAGTPGYMAPEQLRADSVLDKRTDIWALGVLLYELVCGQLPFNAKSAAEVSVEILTEEPVPLVCFLRDAPEPLVAVISRCMQKDPAKRFADVAELAEALAEIAPPYAQGSIERVQRLARPGPLPPPSAGRVTPSKPRTPRAHDSEVATLSRPGLESLNALSASSRQSRTPLLALGRRPAAVGTSIALFMMLALAVSFSPVRTALGLSTSRAPTATLPGPLPGALAGPLAPNGQMIALAPTATVAPLEPSASPSPVVGADVPPAPLSSSAPTITAARATTLTRTPAAPTSKSPRRATKTTPDLAEGFGSRE